MNISIKELEEKIIQTVNPQSDHFETGDLNQLFEQFFQSAESSREDFQRHHEDFLVRSQERKLLFRDVGRLLQSLNTRRKY